MGGVTIVIVLRFRCRCRMLNHCTCSSSFASIFMRLLSLAGGGVMGIKSQHMEARKLNAVSVAAACDSVCARVCVSSCVRVCVYAGVCPRACMFTPASCPPDDTWWQLTPEDVEDEAALSAPNTRSPRQLSQPPPLLVGCCSVVRIIIFGSSCEEYS
eukprot:GHVU01228859.1.p1 GENE.GHVU01228859.1~~GHVU01228859.1.p1  ORF type:complete len:157 (-),score=2.21 GHVU01228859.1:228-698(-)